LVNVLYCRCGPIGDQHDEAALLITQGEVQLVAGILAVILIAIVLLRRKGKKKPEEDEF